MTLHHDDQKLYCNFCGKSRDKVEKLIAGPSVYICDECISISYNIIQEEITEQIQQDISDIPTPEEIHAFLDEHIIGNTSTKEVMSVCAYNHYKRIRNHSPEIEIEKSNILLVGSTGSGKTLFAKTLAKKLDVPFAIADATTLTEAGYVGEDVESILERLLSLAEYDVEKAQKGIVFIDEIDKKARKGESNITKDVSGEGVQQALLRLIEGTIAKVKVNNGSKRFGAEEYVEFDTSNILFIVGGAFVGLDKEVIRRLKKKSAIGFNSPVVSQVDAQKYLEYLSADDVISYGLLPELIGRLPIITTLKKLGADDLEQVLLSVKNSIINQMKELFLMDDIEIVFGRDYIRSVADYAASVDLGARALKGYVENSLFHLMYNAPKFRKNGVVKIIVDKYPVDIDSYPELIYNDGKTQRLFDYKLYRGDYAQK